MRWRRWRGSVHYQTAEQRVVGDAFHNSLRSADREVAMETKILGKGVYDLTEAARLTGLRRARVKEWFNGRDARPGAGPVSRSDYDAINRDLAISCLDLVELL